MADAIPEEEITRRHVILQDPQRAIQIRRSSLLIGAIEEVHVEGRNKALDQWIGRTSTNRTLNFTHPETVKDLVGTYLPVQVTRAGPNSLVGEAALN